jgi:predicted RNase H-like HicB family nuclease
LFFIATIALNGTHWSYGVDLYCIEAIAMNFTLECEREVEGRWLAEVPELPGVLAYGASSEEAMAKAEVLALRVLADRLEHGESPAIGIQISRPTAAVNAIEGTRVMHPVPQHPLGVSPTKVVEAARYLEQERMAVSLLRDLHHSPRRDETFAATVRYFSAKTELQLRNQRYGARLIFVADQHQSTGLPLEQLVQEALRRHPK